MARHEARLGRWHAEFDPRDIDVAGTDIVVVTEVWDRNDYRVDLDEGFTGTVLDVGANIGAFSVLAAKAGARVIAVEPERDNFARLTHHVDLNRCEHVTLVRAAVTDGTTGQVQMVGGGGGAHVNDLPVETLGGQYEEEHDVVTVTLPELLDAYGPVQMMKMDIEGGEFPIFAALDASVLARIDRIAMEWHGPASPHLTHLAGDEFGPLVTKLAQAGRLETIGQPDRGGLLYWTRY